MAVFETADITVVDCDGTAAAVAGLLVVVVIVAELQFVRVTIAGFVSCDICHSITTQAATN